MPERDTAMNEFFHGWRRNAGCVTLVMALILAGGWPRSFITVDFFEVRSEKHAYRMISIGGALKFVRSTQHRYRPEYRFWDTREFADYQENYQDYWLACDVCWRWDFAGLHFGAGRVYPDTTNEHEIAMYVFPYSSIILSLTVLSAYLILWKPRKRASPN